MKKNKIKIEILFFIVSIFFGIFFVFIVPPFQSFDEDTHFMKAYMISKGQILPKKIDNNIGFFIPENINKYIQDKLNYIGKSNQKYTYIDNYNDQLLPYSYDSIIFRDISTSRTTPIAHIVPAVGVKVGMLNRAFASYGDVGPAVLLQYARLFCLVIYSIIGYCAIKITPKFKKSFFTILLLPTSIFLRSTVSYDSILLVVIALSMAKMLQMYEDKNYKFTRYDYLIFCICGYILLNIKIVYSIVFLLMFFIPSNRFGNLKKKIKAYIIMIGIVLIFTFITRLLYINLSSSNRGITEQFQFVLQNPIKFFNILNINFVKQFYMQRYCMIGAFGLLDTYLPVLLVELIYLYLFIVLLYEILKENCNLPVLVNIIYAALFYISILAIYASMYIGWTPIILNIIGGNAIEGVQGRYFLPHLLMIPLLFSNKYIAKIYKKIKNKLQIFNNFFDTYYWIMPCLFIILSLFVLMQRYYF